MKLSCRVMLSMCVSWAATAFGAESSVESSGGDEVEIVKTLPCRPTIACNAEMVPGGTFEVEAGYAAKGALGTASHSGQLLLKYSVIDVVQLQLASNNVFLVGPGITARAMDGVMPGVKVKWLEQSKWLPSNAVSVHLMLPTQSFADAAQRTIDASAWWYISKDIGPVHGDLNFAVTAFDLTARPTVQGLATLAVSLDLGHGFAIMTEAYSTFGDSTVVPLDGGWLNAVSFNPIDGLAIDLGGDVGFYPGARGFTFFAGLTFAPPRRRAGGPRPTARSLSSPSIATSAP